MIFGTVPLIIRAVKLFGRASGVIKVWRLFWNDPRPQQDSMTIEAILFNPVVVVGVVSVVAIWKYLSNGERTIILPKLGPPPKFADTDPDVIVVGGGITGASCAARFGMSGKKVVMIERDMGFVDTYRGEVLLPGGINALDKMGMKDVLNEIDGNPVKGECYFDVRMGGAIAYVEYPAPGGLVMRHGYLIDALRKKAVAQESVTVIEGAGRELLKENGRVVGVRYHKKKEDGLKELRAPLVVVGEGYYSKLAAEYRTTHKPVSTDLCIGLLMKNYKFVSGTEKRGEYLEFGIGHPDSQLATYRLNDRETRAVIFVKGKTPSNVKDFCYQKVVPSLPEHMKGPVEEAIADGPRVIRCQRMAANFDVIPGMIVMGDALNTRHHVSASGMTVALNDVLYWWKFFTEGNHSFTDDAAILQQKLVFRKDRLKYSFVINVWAETVIRLINDHDPSTVLLQQQFVKDLYALAKPDTPQQDKDDLFNIVGLTETDPEVLKRVFDGSIEGTVKEIYRTRPYFTAMWESFQVKRKWKAIISDVMEEEATTS